MSDRNLAIADVRTWPVFLLAFSILAFGAIFTASAAFLWKSDSRLELAEQDTLGAVPAKKYAPGNQGEIKGATVGDCDVRVAGVWVPLYWDGIQKDESESVDVVGLAEVPPLSSAVSGEISSFVQGYLASALDGGDDGRVLVADGVLRCAGPECKTFPCRATQIRNEVVVVCERIPTDPQYEHVLSDDIVATVCTVEMCGEVRESLCLFRDYVRVYHTNVLLSGSFCADYEDTPYCDFDKFQEAVYCKSGACEVAGFTQYEGNSVMPGR